MKKVYTYLLIGCLFTTLDLSIGGLHLLPDSIGYLLIVIGAYLGEKHQRIQEMVQAKYLGIALIVYSLIYPFLQEAAGNETLWPLVSLSLTAQLATLYLFYSLIKAEYIWHPQTQTRLFITNYLTLGIIQFAATCLSYFVPVLGILSGALALISAIYLIYIFYTLREQQSTPE